MAEKLNFSVGAVAPAPTAEMGSAVRLPHRSSTPRNRASLGTALSDIQPLSEIVGVSGVNAAAIEIGQLIRRERIAKGMNQIDLADAVGIAQGALSNIERGKGRDGPSYRLLRQLAVALGRPFMSFLSQRDQFDSPDVITVIGASEGIAQYAASIGGFINGLLDRTVLIDLRKQLEALVVDDVNQSAVPELYQSTMCRVLPHAHTSVETHGVTVFVTVNGELEIKSAHQLGSFEKGYIVPANETVEVVNPSGEPTAFLSVPAKLFLASSGK